MEKWRRVRIKRAAEEDGTLFVMERNREVPFDIQRIFLVTNVKKGKTRGDHATKKTRLILFPVSLPLALFPQPAILAVGAAVYIGFTYISTVVFLPPDLFKHQLPPFGAGVFIFVRIIFHIGWQVDSLFVLFLFAVLILRRFYHRLIAVFTQPVQVFLAVIPGIGYHMDRLQAETGFHVLQEWDQGPRIGRVGKYPYPYNILAFYRHQGNLRLGQNVRHLGNSWNIVAPYSNDKHHMHAKT